MSYTTTSSNTNKLQEQCLCGKESSYEQEFYCLDCEKILCRNCIRNCLNVSKKDGPEHKLLLLNNIQQRSKIKQEMDNITNPQNNKKENNKKND